MQIYCLAEVVDCLDMLAYPLIGNPTQVVTTMVWLKLDGLTEISNRLVVLAPLPIDPTAKVIEVEGFVIRGCDASALVRYLKAWS